MSVPTVVQLSTRKVELYETGEVDVFNNEPRPEPEAGEGPVGPLFGVEHGAGDLLERFRAHGWLWPSKNHAAFFGATMPEGGGRPVLTPRGRRATEGGSAAAIPPNPATCPACHLALPLTGQCDFCSS